VPSAPRPRHPPSERPWHETPPTRPSRPHAVRQTVAERTASRTRSRRRASGHRTRRQVRPDRSDRGDDRRHCRADEPARSQRRHRSGPGGANRQGLCRRRDEVRKLAERSSRATKEIASLIAEVQARYQQAVEAMNAGAVVVEQGATMAAQAGSSLDESPTPSRHPGRGRPHHRCGGRNELRIQWCLPLPMRFATIAAQTNSAAASMTASADTVSAPSRRSRRSAKELGIAEEVSAATEEMSAQPKRWSLPRPHWPTWLARSTNSWPGSGLLTVRQPVGALRARFRRLGRQARKRARAA